MRGRGWKYGAWENGGMSMLGGPQVSGNTEVGEMVASFPEYEAAQKAVSKLIAAEIAARDIAIVGLRSSLHRAGDGQARLRDGGPLGSDQRRADRAVLRRDPRPGQPGGADPGLRRRAVRRHRGRDAAEPRHLLLRASPPRLRQRRAGHRRPLRGHRRLAQHPSGSRDPRAQRRRRLVHRDRRRPGAAGAAAAGRARPSAPTSRSA